MPEQPPEKRRPSSNVSDATTARGVTTLPYAELHCRSNFSFLEGASHADELVEQAAALGLKAISITDRNSVAGVVRAHVAAKGAGLKLLIGAEITPVDAPALLLWVMNRAGYGRLCRLITRGRQQAPKGSCLLRLDEVIEFSPDLLAGVCLAPLMRGSTLSDDDAASIERLKTCFGDRLYLIAELHHGPSDRTLLNQMRRIAESFKLPLIAANDVHYHVPARQRLQDVLTATRYGCSVAELGELRFPNAERHLKSAAQMAELFREYPEAVTRTAEVAARCSFSLDELRYDYPEELCPPGQTPIGYLTQLTLSGAYDRYPKGVPDKVRRLLDHELQLIGELNYPAYFLTVWDLVRFARSRDILCQGRGSAANSAVCYCLGVTSVDPDRVDTLFERFISKERNEAPDIDVDFEHERREEVIQYLYEKYGRERAGMTAAVISYRPRSAMRDVGKALGLSLDQINQLTRHVDHLHDREKLELRMREAGVSPDSSLGKRLIDLVLELLEFPRHLSQHTGGMVLTNSPLCELVPIENASMSGRTVVEWDKNDLDSLGILKVDVLALGMLTAIRKCFDLVRVHHRRRYALATIPAHDSRVFDMICRADTVGVFQIESRAQMAMLPRLKPRCFYDLVIEVAIVRPGPIQGDMVHPYLRRRCGEESVEYPDDRVRAILQKTLGVPIFQEQAMRLAIVAAGFTPGEADQLRRAMGAWRKRGIIDQFQLKLVNGMTANGYSTEFAQRVFQQLQGFGEYGFPESHSCSFALLVWASAWLKHHYPAAFAAALLNSQPMGFYGPAQLVSDARKHGVDVLPIDVNHSQWDCTLEEVTRPAKPVSLQARSASESVPLPLQDEHALAGASGSYAGTVGRVSTDSKFALRLGFRLLKGIAQDVATTLAARRVDRPYSSTEDLAQRTGLSKAILLQLSRAGAMQSLQAHRREAVWNMLSEREDLPLLDTVPPTNDEPSPGLERMTEMAEVVADYRHSGLSLKKHPVAFLRPQLDQLRVATATRLASLRHGQLVRVAGLVLVRQRPGTAGGVTFVTLEDETGVANLIVYSSIWDRFHVAASTASMLLATGSLQREGQIIHVLVGKLEDVSQQIAQLPGQSRDFR